MSVHICYPNITSQMQVDPWNLLDNQSMQNGELGSSVTDPMSRQTRKMPDILLWCMPLHACTHMLTFSPQGACSWGPLEEQLLWSSQRTKTLCHLPSLQKPFLPRPGQPLDEPLTRLDGENPQQALEINRVVSDTLRRDRVATVKTGEVQGSPVLSALAFVSTAAAAPGGRVPATLAGADHGRVPGEAGTAAAGTSR